MIPKNIIQTSPRLMKSHTISELFRHANGYKHIHTTDTENINFLEEYICKDFPNAIDQYKNFFYGQHKAELYRYSALYTYGGLYLDSDCVLVTNPNDFLKDYEFVSVKTMNEDWIWTGLIASTKSNIIMYRAIELACTINPRILDNDYQFFAKHLFKIIQEEKLVKTTLLEETYIDWVRELYCMTYKGKPVLLNYSATRDVPYLIDNPYMVRNIYQ